MNYYEHHIGDYAEATAHLTFVEDAAYTRMIRKYYAQEKPLPTDVKAVQRLVGARSKEEREAIETILGEFFELQDDGWHNGRCDAELVRYLEKSEGKDAKREAEKERQRRHRERRKELFEALRQHGKVPSFETTTDDLVTMLSQVVSQHVTQPVTRDATANQTPVTSHQSPDLKPDDHHHHASSIGDQTTGDPADFDPPLYGAPLPPREVPPPPDGDNQPAIALTVDLRKWGVNATFTHPTVQDWANREIPRDILAAAVAEAREVKGEAKIAPNYLAPIVERLLNPPPKAEPQKPKSEDWAWKRSNQGIEAKGRELNMFARGGESYPDFAARIQIAIDKRKGQP
jgi:uncharacterized protein YdaU (DUF1376 family)